MTGIYLSINKGSSSVTGIILAIFFILFNCFRELVCHNVRERNRMEVARVQCSIYAMPLKEAKDHLLAFRLSSHFQLVIISQETGPTHTTVLMHSDAQKCWRRKHSLWSFHGHECLLCTLLYNKLTQQRRKKDIYHLKISFSVVSVA